MEMSAEKICQSNSNAAMFCQQTANRSEQMIAACETIFFSVKVLRKQITWTNEESLCWHIYFGSKTRTLRGMCVQKFRFNIE